jgi:hypothetical protein
MSGPHDLYQGTPSGVPQFGQMRLQALLLAGAQLLKPIGTSAILGTAEAVPGYKRVEQDVCHKRWCRP